jgi:hypothetical protein
MICRRPLLRRLLKGAQGVPDFLFLDSVSYVSNTRRAARDGTGRVATRLKERR